MPSGIANTGTHPKLLWPGIKAIWGMDYPMLAREYTDLFDQETSSQAYEEMLQITGYGLASIKTEGGSGTYDSEMQGVLTRAYHIAYSLGYVVTYEELKDNLYAQVAANRAKANRFSMDQTIENIAAFVYNNAFATTYFVTGDGKALCATDHVNVSGGTYSNALSPAADLAEPSLEDMTVQIMGVQNDRGLNISLMPQSLHVPRQEWYNANRVLKSTLQSGNNNNDINVLKATNALPGGIKMNHYFTAAHAWFVRTNCPQGMTMFWREKPFLEQDNDFDTKNAKALAYMRLSVTCGDPRSIFGSNGP